MSEDITQQLVTAFVQGAKWWEWHKTGGNDGGATMWQSDQRLAHAEAVRRRKAGTLGKLPDYEKAKVHDVLPEDPGRASGPDDTRTHEG